MCIRDSLEAVRQRHIRHADLMLQPCLGSLERCRHVEDLLTVLNRDDPPVGEGATISRPVDLVDDRCVDVAAFEKIGV